MCAGVGALVHVDQEAVRARVAAVLPAVPEVAAAYLFGSALGECRPDSDVDVALILRAAREAAPDFSPAPFEGVVAAALGPLAGHPVDVVALDRTKPLIAMEALHGRQLYVADQDELADFIEVVARAYPDARYWWDRAVADVLAGVRRP